MNLNKQFLWSSHLEFAFQPPRWSVSKKILYRAYGDTKLFKENILCFLRENISFPEVLWKIEAIFSLPQTQNLVFHFWEDIETRRVKFYISLYNLPLKTSLQIISELKKILNIYHYILEKNFIAFDCVGFDIQNNTITLKVYELVSFQGEYLKFLPSYVDKNNVKEVWFLKSWRRRKIFFRLKKAQDISKIYPDISWKMTYYCREEEKEEIYFI